jgi:universal stress protein A
MKIRASRRSRNVVLEMESKDSALPPVAVSELRLKQILVAVDFSASSRKAFYYATHFARQFDAEIMLLHVIVSAPPPPGMLVFEAEELNVKYYEQAARQLADWRREIVPALRVKAVTRTGTAAHQEIVEAARESNIDLIVIGNHGLTGFSRLLLGSTAERVVRHAPCPVLVIREREHDFIEEVKASAEKSKSQPAQPVVS